MQFYSATTTMDFSRDYGAVKNVILMKKSNNRQLKNNELINGVGTGLSPYTVSVLKLQDSRALRLMSWSLFLALFGSIILGSSSNRAVVEDVSDADHTDMNEDFKLSQLPNLFHDLIEVGLLRKGHRGLVISPGVDDGDSLLLAKDLDFLNHNGVDFGIVSESNFNGLIPDQDFDFVVVWSFKNAKAIDRVIKIGGVVVSQLNNNPQNELQQPENYRIVYLRQFDQTMIAMRKMLSVRVDGLLTDKSARRLLCGSTPVAKKEALRGLEDAMLEPPRRIALASRKIKFLPDLLNDSLENYPRRIFISDDDGAEEWFRKNYPARNQEFEVYNLGISDMNGRPSSGGAGVAEWLRNQMREEDYVVMKAEAAVVEELIKEKGICLVDELFMECKNQWEEDGDDNSDQISKRPFWECLTLYGRLRDEGVAVHQWWT